MYHCYVCCEGGAAGLAAFVLFRRPPALWASRGNPEQQSTGGSGRTQLAASSVISGEVDETEDEPAPVDPEQVRRGSLAQEAAHNGDTLSHRWAGLAY